MNKNIIMPLKDIVLFSKSKIKIDIDSKYYMGIKDKIDKDNGNILVLSLKESAEKAGYSADDFYKVGNMVKIKDVTENNGVYSLNVRVMYRVKVNEFEFDEKHFYGIYEELHDTIDIDLKSVSDMIGYMKNIIKEISGSIRGSEGYTEYLLQLDDVNDLVASLMPYLNISREEKQGMLEMTSLRKKSLRFLDIMIEWKEFLKFQLEMNSKMSDSMNSAYREKMLREQLKNIQEELNETEGTTSKKDYRTMVKEKSLPEDIERLALEEVGKLERMGPSNSESNVIMNYLDLVLNLPWESDQAKEIDISKASLDLNKNHFGLEKVKDRIIQHISVMKLKKNKQGSILLLVGPPGTGKTSLARSISEALNRNYVRISLGGIRDEAEIRGHRRTYIGAMPGKIVQGMKRAGSKNPVFVLDEIDKVMTSANGDPAAALLEVLDPEQNKEFNDHYLDMPYDLSDVFFIATANDLRRIPGPLRDRMEIIQIGSYTSVEKYHIAVDHLFDKSLEDHGLLKGDIQVSENAMKTIIAKYTMEAGVRNLKRQLDKLVRVSSEKIVTGKVDKPYKIRENMIFSILGHEISRYDTVAESNIPGVVTGLAWTPVGGDILYIESTFIPGRGNLMVTGQLGDVMKESVRISLSLIKSRLFNYMSPEDFAKVDLHVHVPAGATPKDGPSAGVTMLSAIASLVTKIPVDSKMAMTGEISLRGAVLPVGGIKEKVIAAQRSGIKKILIPFDNKKDIEDVPQEVKKQVDFIYVKTVEEVLKHGLGIEVMDYFQYQHESEDKVISK